MKYSIKNEKGQLLKYIYKDRLVFNGESSRDRKVLIYSFAKESTAANMIIKIEKNFGKMNLSVAELTDVYFNDEQSSLISETIKNSEKQKNSTFEELHDVETINEKCLGCNHSCKQSKNATIHNCSLYSC